MIRLPTAREIQAAQVQAAAHLEKVWVALHSPEGPEAIFNDAERVIQAPLSPWGRIRIAEALLRYCKRVEEALEAEALKGAIKQAKRLVGRVRREIADLKSSRDRYEQQLARSQAWPGARLRVLSAETGRECAALYQSLKDAVEELESLAGYDVSSPHERLVQPTNEAWEAVWKVQPPFRYADCEKALSDLDGLLKDWGAKTGSRKGQSWESKGLNDLIDDLGKAFKEATGTCAVDASDQRARYVTKEHETAALREAMAKFKAGELGGGMLALDVAIPPPEAPADYPQTEWSADALTLLWPCGGKVVIPRPFLEALRRGMNETTERLLLAIDTLVGDWRVRRIKPAKWQSGRNYFLGGVRNTLAKLPELERPPATGGVAAEPAAAVESNKTLH